MTQPQPKKKTSNPDFVSGFKPEDQLSTDEEEDTYSSFGPKDEDWERDIEAHF